MLLCYSNIFMAFAWYGHLKNLSAKPWIIAALISWGIALFEYLLQVPANRIGSQAMNLGQLKILQEVITLAVCPLFSVLHERAVADRLSLGGFVPAGRGILHFSRKTVRLKSRTCFET